MLFRSGGPTVVYKVSVIRLLWVGLTQHASRGPSGGLPHFGRGHVLERGVAFMRRWIERTSGVRLGVGVFGCATAAGARVAPIVQAVNDAPPGSDGSGCATVG